MYLLYQAIGMFFLKIRSNAPWIYIGAAVYAAGVLLFIMATIGFAKPDEHGVCQSGLYRFSRNSMYVAYFLGCVVLTQSMILFVMLCVFQFSAHFIILSEERWGIENFGTNYRAYMKSVRRYL